MSRLLTALIRTTIHSALTSFRFKNHFCIFDRTMTAFFRLDMKYFSSEIHTNSKYISSENRLNT